MSVAVGREVLALLDAAIAGSRATLKRDTDAVVGGGRSESSMAERAELVAGCRPALRKLLPDRTPCGQCGSVPGHGTVMVHMAPGFDKRPWQLCGTCWRGEL